MVTASLLASLEPEALSDADAARFVEAMDALSDTAFGAYRGLVYDTPAFKDFFRAMTPIAEIAGLKIGSRPSSRTKSSAIEDLRAIPVEESAQQCERGVDRIDMILRFGAHGFSS